ncbi:glycosyl transferase family 90 [Helicobacter canis]|uniref:Lipopolysaccharide core biosynthesis protein n=1 Tax=Helicobacter canis TaxID=29419 RepID=A0A377J6R1_9HELI|nr:glycosyl transferase family 90 [Helicobacter canis]STO97975.1 lipopolysaccharide core biosynthesis protein [Helicobacter canis]
MGAKILYNLKGIYRMLLPRAIPQALLRSKIQAIFTLDRATLETIALRVAHYHKLNSHFSPQPFALPSHKPVRDTIVPPHFGALRDNKLTKEHSSVYFYDSYEWTRYFPDHFVWNYEFSDVNYYLSSPAITKTRPIHSARGGAGDSACSDKSAILRGGLAHYRPDKSLRPPLENANFSSTILESQSGFTKQTENKTTALESTFEKTEKMDSSPNASFLSSRVSFARVAIHKSANEDSRSGDSASAEFVDCHAVQAPLAMTENNAENKNAVSLEKVDSSDEAKNLTNSAENSRILELESGFFEPRKEIRLECLSTQRGDEIHDSSPKAESTTTTPAQENSILLQLEKHRHFSFIHDPIPYDKKRDLLFFRGACPQEHRSRFLHQYFSHPLCDIGHTGAPSEHPEFTTPKVPKNKHLHYKFLLSLEGNDVASNLKWILGSNSLCIMPKPRYESWFMEEKLEANVHYALLDDDYGNLDALLEFFTAHPKDAKEIIHNANTYCQAFQNPRIEEACNLLVLRKYFYLSDQGDLSPDERALLGL